MTMRTIAPLAMVALLFALALCAPGVRAEDDACRAKCEQWGAPCSQACADAPVIEECKANCRKMYQQCLSDCAASSRLERRDGVRGDAS